MLKVKLRTRLVQSVVILAVLMNVSSMQAHEKSHVESNKLKQIVDGKHRTPLFAARDKYRHPLETLNFFGIKDTMTVVEISPGGGWYSEILAPYLRDNGLYIAAGYDPLSKREYFKRSAKKFQDKLDANPEIYDKTKLAIMQAPKQLDFAKPSSADMILSFRNTHNWHRSGDCFKYPIFHCCLWDEYDQLCAELNQKYHQVLRP